MRTTVDNVHIRPFFKKISNSFQGLGAQVAIIRIEPSQDITGRRLQTLVDSTDRPPIFFYLQGGEIHRLTVLFKDID